MCGRYFFSSSPDEVGDEFDVDVRDNFPPRWNIAPTQPIAIITSANGGRAYGLARWGFIPSWAKGDYLKKLGSRPLINARSETAAEKPTFRNAFKRRRCLIPANGFYEWKSEKGGKQPYLIRPCANGLIAFAGLWETAIDPDGGEIDTAAILTVDSGPDVAPLHNREPAIVRPADYDRWLETDETEAASLAPLLRPPPKGYWRYYPVSKEVNSPRAEGERLGQSIETGELFE